MKALIDILNREKHIVEDIEALVHEAEWTKDPVILDALYVEKENKQKLLDGVRDELLEYFETLTKKES